MTQNEKDLVNSIDHEFTAMAAARAALAETTKLNEAIRKPLSGALPVAVDHCVRLAATVRVLKKMTCPSIPHILKNCGYEYEAGCVQDVITAVRELDEFLKPYLREPDSP